MIHLNLRQIESRLPPDTEGVVSVDQIEQQVTRAFADWSRLVGQQRSMTVSIPTDVLANARTLLFPAERMLVAPTRTINGRRILGPPFDITGKGPRTHHAHVEADPDKLRSALMAFELTGAPLGAWIHSHPGSGPFATQPSEIDRHQYASWTRDFTSSLLGIIVVADGFVRFWGDAIDSGSVRIELIGGGVQRIGGHRNVYRLAC